jgi:hypothetical protein
MPRNHDRAPSNHTATARIRARLIEFGRERIGDLLPNPPASLSQSSTGASEAQPKQLDTAKAAPRPSVGARKFRQPPRTRLGLVPCTTLPSMQRVSPSGSMIRRQSWAMVNLRAQTSPEAPSISTSATIATTAPERWPWAMPRPTNVSPLRSGFGDGRGGFTGSLRETEGDEAISTNKPTEAARLLPRNGPRGPAVRGVARICGPTGSRGCAVRDGEARSSSSRSSPRPCWQSHRIRPARQTLAAALTAGRSAGRRGCRQGSSHRWRFGRARSPCSRTRSQPPRHSCRGRRGSGGSRPGPWGPSHAFMAHALDPHRAAL